MLYIALHIPLCSYAQFFLYWYQVTLPLQCLTHFCLDLNGNNFNVFARSITH